jgi:uncharacterized protein (TIGR02246 family)
MRGRKHKNISLFVAGLMVTYLFVTIGCRKKTEPTPPPAEPTAAVDEIKGVVSIPDDERAVRRLANEFIAAICSNDPEPFRRLGEIYADDVRQITMEGKIIQGKRDNLFYYSSLRKKNLVRLRSRTARYDIRSIEISCDVAVVFGEVEVERWGKNAPEPHRGSFWETLVFRKVGGRWHLAQEQSTKIKPDKQRGKRSKADRPAAEKTGRRRKHTRGKFVGFSVGVKGASDDTNKPVISDSND